MSGLKISLSLFCSTISVSESSLGGPSSSCSLREPSVLLLGCLSFMFQSDRLKIEDFLITPLNTFDPISSKGEGLISNQLLEMSFSR